MKSNKSLLIRRHRAVALLFMLLILPGCSTIHVYQAGNQQGIVEGNQGGTEWTDGKRVNTFFWGAMRQDVIITKCREGDESRLNLEEIKIEKNFGSILATIVTLGLWEPVKISWKCAKPKVPTGNLD